MEPENQHILRTLKMIMRVLGYTNRDIERQLGLSSSYLSRLFSGGMELRFQHIVQIARVMGMEPEEVFQLAYSEPKEPSEAMKRLRSATGGFQPPPPPPSPNRARTGPTEEELERLMARTLRKFFSEMAKIETD